METKMEIIWSAGIGFSEVCRDPVKIESLNTGIQCVV